MNNQVSLIDQQDKNGCGPCESKFSQSKLYESNQSDIGSTNESNPGP